MLHHSPRYWFTLIEMLLVISILAIAIVMSRSLFQNPNQDIIESEVCINTLSSTLESFFLNATLGKTLSDGQQPDLYVIGLNLIDPKGWWSSIDFYTFKKKQLESSQAWWGVLSPPRPPWTSIWRGAILSRYTIQTHEQINRSEFTNFSNCRQDNKYHIILSTNIKTKQQWWPMPTNPTPQDTRSAKNRILIALSPHDHSFASGGMSILHTEQRIPFFQNCFPPTCYQQIEHTYASFILTYNFCKQEPDYNSNLALANCLPLYKTKFDTRSQTIKHSKCIQYNRSTNQCNKRSINFDE